MGARGGGTTTALTVSDLVACVVPEAPVHVSVRVSGNVNELLGKESLPFALSDAEGFHGPPLPVHPPLALLVCQLTTIVDAVAGKGFGAASKRVMAGFGGITHWLLALQIWSPVQSVLLVQL